MTNKIVATASKKRRADNDAQSADISMYDTDSEGNYSTTNLLNDNLNAQLHNIEDKLDLRITAAMATMTKSITALVERLTNKQSLPVNTTENQPSTSAAALNTNILVPQDTLINLESELDIQPQPKPILKPSTKRARSKSPNVNMSYAAALARSAKLADTIRNIKLIGDPDVCAATMAELQKQTRISINIPGIKIRGDFNLTVKCDTSVDAAIVEQTFATKFGLRMEINTVKKTLPQVKITGVLLDKMSDEQLIECKRQRNHWLRDNNYNR